MAVPELAWYLRMRMGWGTGSSPTSVPCCKNLRISDSSVRPLQRDRSGTSLACPIDTTKTAAAQSISLNKHRHSRWPWPPRTHSLHWKKELRRDQTNKKLGKQNNTSSAETVMLSIIFYKVSPRGPPNSSNSANLTELFTHCTALSLQKCTYLSMQIFSTWGTSTCKSRMIVCRGSFDFQDMTCK